MPWEQRDFDDVYVDRIKSLQNTLARYRATSVRAHGKLSPQVKEVERLLLLQVEDIREQKPDSVKVNAAADKFLQILKSEEPAQAGE